MKIKGFTLIELVIVIAVVMCFTSILLPHWKTLLDTKAAEQRARTDTYHATAHCLWWEDKDGTHHAKCKQGENHGS
jgi:Tfp pilus assembly protein PilE